MNAGAVMGTLLRRLGLRRALTPPEERRWAEGRLDALARRLARLEALRDDSRLRGRDVS